MGSLRFSTLNMLFSLLLLFVLLLKHVTSDCVMYGYCHSKGDSYQQCVYDGPPKLLTNSTGLEILQTWCPSLVNKTDETYTCCDSDQIILGLLKQINSMAAVFKRCPSCQENLITLACYSTCDVMQSKYTAIREVQLNEETYKRYVTAIDFYVSSYFMEGAYKSCSNVAIPSMGKTALDATCGSYSASQCTPERWFYFLGDSTQNPKAPIFVHFRRLDKPFLNYLPFNEPVYRCNETSRNNSAPCSCVDCLESCPEAQKYSVMGYSFMIGSIDGVGLIIIFIFSACLTAFLVLRFRCAIQQKNNHNHFSNISPDDDLVVNSFLSKLSDKTEQKIERWFFNCGKGVATMPTLVLAISSWAIAVCTYGILQLDVTSDPVKIWAAPDSRSRLEKNYYEERFGPFYRTEQIFFKAINLPNIQHNTSSGVIEFGPAFNKDFLLTIFELQDKIYNIPGLQELCFSPLSNAKTAETLSQCTVMSLWGYFGNDVGKFNQTHIDENGYTVNYLDTIYKCLKSNTNCLAPYGGTVDPAAAVGDFLQYGDEAYERAGGVAVTFLLTNYISQDKLRPAIEWEKEFIRVVKNWTETEMPDFMDIAFNTEISLQNEISKESVEEASTIVISYLLMFVYVSLALGSYNSCRSLLLKSKIFLGMGGIILVLSSISSAVGIFGYLHLNTSLLTMEVIPFLILAVGVDNMFLLVSSVMRNEDMYKDPIECIAYSVSEVGPSILLTTLSEAACFGIGGIVNMPAVRTFALYAFAAILINFLLQMTAFIAFLVLHLRRIRNNRLDILFCIKVSDEGIHEHQSSFLIQNLIGRYIVPVLFNPIINSILLIVFFAVFCMSIAFIPHIEPGLDQKLAMSKDSDTYKYFVFMEEILSIGPPVYFVLKPGLNFTDEKQQNFICGSLNCNEDSLNTQIFAASKDSKITRIRTAASSWLDDYFDWSTVDDCCKIYKNGTFCPHNIDSEDCINCNITTNADGMRPDSQSFAIYLPFFLEDNPDIACAKSGHAAYGNAVNYELDMDGLPLVKDSYFMAYHTRLRTSKDFYTALEVAREVAENITEMLNKDKKEEDKIEVFPYSIFYVYYEQYLTIWTTMISSLIYSLAAVFIVTFIFTSFDFKSSLIVLITVFMIVTDLAGLMYWWSINLNAITLVNLVVAVGISVEFCSHIVRSFSISSKQGRKLRSQDALINTGSSVFAGIAVTKFIGISVLAFSKTQVFQVFYFRMYLGMVIFGAVHGLIFLPILLSYIGPNNEEKMVLRRRRKRFCAVNSL